MIKDFIDTIKTLSSSLAAAVTFALAVFMFLKIAGVVSTAGIALTQIIAELIAIVTALPIELDSDNEKL